MNRVRAKMVVQSISVAKDGSTNIQMTAVYSNDPNSENKAFSDATPAASFSMTIAKDKPAAKMFVQGEEYFVDFKPCKQAAEPVAETQQPALSPEVMERRRLAREARGQQAASIEDLVKPRAPEPVAAPVVTSGKTPTLEDPGA